MSSPDINLGPGDTAPLTAKTLENPDGSPMDLTGTTIRFWYQPRNRSVAKTSRVVAIVGDPKLGNTLIDWLATGGAIAPGDYIARYVVTYLDTHQASVPNGDQRIVDGSDSRPDPTFFWLAVAPDFTPVP